MANIGRAYLKQRFDGKADDLASVFASRGAKGISIARDLCAWQRLGPEKPIVGFYALELV